jgi:hypothetical protein
MAQDSRVGIQYAPDKQDSAGLDIPDQENEGLIDRD